MKKDDANIKIEPEEASPLVLRLLSVIDTLQLQLMQQSEKMDSLIEEIRRLKKLSPKPKIKSSTLPKDPDDPGNGSATPSGGGLACKQRPGSSKRSKNKTLKIDREEKILVENVPAEARRKGYEDYIVQDLIIKPQVTKYRLERFNRT